MHVFAILIAVAIAGIIRQKSTSSSQNWSQRWYEALFLFLFPSLLLLVTAFAILYMGCHGKMLGVRAGSLGCLISGSSLLFACSCLLKLAYKGDRSISQVASYPQQTVGQTTARIIDLDLPYSAQIGFWQSELVVSEGLLETLDAEHLAAVIAHEQAHLYYRDTFWFFWLGWIRSFSFWLPHTEALWQELLLLRELRADRKAAESVDFLLLAESLVTLAQAPLKPDRVCCANLNHAGIGDRLNERIDFLLSDEPVPASYWHDWTWLGLVLVPLLIIPLHS